MSIPEAHERAAVSCGTRRGDQPGVCFQPIIDTTERRICGHECFIRLSNRCTYYHTGITEASQIELAVRAAARQSVSEVYFLKCTPPLAADLKSWLRLTADFAYHYGLPSGNLIIEASEDDMPRIYDDCRYLGFRLALDGAGTTLACLQIVRDLRPDWIKLDRNIVRDVEKPLYAATIRKFLELSGLLGLHTTAAGVDRLRTLENLWLLGAAVMQGTILGEPAPRIVRGVPDLAHLQDRDPESARLIQSDAAPALAYLN